MGVEMNKDILLKDDTGPYTTPRLTFTFNEGEPPYRVTAFVTVAGQDWICVLTGGTQDHVGAVVLAEPAVCYHPVTGERALLTEDENTGPIVQTLVAYGHKDALPAEMFAQALCRKFGARVVCTAGIHVDNASDAAIQLMLENVSRIIERIVR